MNTLDIRTVLFSSIITTAVSAAVMATLWRQNRQRSPELGYWLADFVLQFLSILLIALRGILPDVISVLLGIPLSLTGVLLLFIGLEKHVGLPRGQRYNFILLASFIVVHAFFAFGAPSLSARNITFSLGLLVFCTQCAWLMLRRVDTDLRPATKTIGLIFVLYSLISLARVFADLGVSSGNDLFESGLYDTLAILIYQMLGIGLTFALVLLVNRRLFTALASDIAARRQSEQILTQRESHLRTILQTALDGYWLVDTEGCFLDVNEAYCTMSGYSRDELRQMRILDVESVETEAETQAHIQRIMRQGSDRFETCHRGKDGTLINVEVSVNYQANASPHFTCFLRDITQRKQADEDLRASEARFRSYIEYAPLGVLLIDQAGHLVETNSAGTRLLGYSAAELKKLTFFEIVAPQSYEAGHRFFQALAQLGSITGELALCRKDEASCWTMVSAVKVAGSSFMAFVLDITERKQAHTQIESLARFPDENPNPVLRVTSTGVVEYANAASMELLQEWNCAVGQTLPAAWQTLIQEILSSGKPQEKEVAVDERSLSLSIAPIVTGGYANIYGRDITERKRAEKEKLQLQRQLELILNSAGEAIFGEDAAGRITFVNPATTHMLGWSADELYGQIAHDICHHTRPDGRPYPHDECPVRQSFLDGISHRVDNEVFWRKDGTSFPVEYTSTPIVEDDQTVGAVVVVKDITERKHAEEQLRESENSLKEIAANYPNSYVSIIEKDLIIGFTSGQEFKKQGLDPAQFVGQTLEQVFGEHAPLVRENYLRTFEGVETQFELLINNQFQFYRTVPLVNRDGRIERILAVVENVTERKRAEAALQNALDRLEEAQRVANIGSWEWDAVEDTITGSAEFYRLFDVTPDQLARYAQFIERLHPDDKERVQQDVTAALNQDRPYNTDYRVRLRDGSWRDIYARGRTFSDPEGKPLQMVGTCLDITARKRAENQLRRHAALLSTLLNSPQETVALLDTDGTVLTINLNGAKRFGLSPKEMVGQNIYTLIPEPASSKRKQIVTGVMQTGQPAHFEDQRHDMHFVNSVYSVNDPESGELLGAAIFAVDITERKRMEEALRRERDKAQRYLDIAGVMLIALNNRGEVILINKKGQDILEYDNESEVLGLNWFETCLPERISEEVCGVFSQIMAGEIESTEYYENLVKTRRGGERLIAFRNSVLRDSTGQITGVLCSGEDITERRRAEEALRESEVRYRALFENMAEGFFQAELIEDETGQAVDFRFLEVNPAHSRIIGLTREQVVGRRASELFPDLEKYWLDAVAQVTHTGNPLSIEGYVQATGRYYANSYFSPGPGQFASVFSDITERKRAEGEILQLNATLERRVEERTAELSDLYNNAPCGYHSLDRDGVFVRINDTELKWLGYTREEIIGKMKAPDLFTSSSVTVFQQTFPVFKARGWLRDLELEMIRKDGSLLPVLVSATAIYDEAERFLMSRSTMVDHTDRKRSEAQRQAAYEALQASQARLEAANKELESFAYSISHDLRAPLRAIDGFSRIILEDYADKLDDEGRRLFGIVRSNTQTMDQLITDLLALSRVSRSQLTLQYFDMAVLVQDVYHAIALPDEVRNCTLIVAPLLEACGDPALLRQVWVNLLSNALKYTRPKAERHIEVGSYAQDQVNVYYVKDNGMGFNPAYGHKLFGIFQRLHSAAEFEGTGVGLAIVQRIIHRHGGQVWAEGQLDHGATFYFSLPMSGGDHEQ